MNQNFKSYQALTPGKQVVELRKLANEFGTQPSDVDTFLADLVNSYDCRPGFAETVLKIFEKAWKQADLKGMEMFMNLFRTFTGLEFRDFLNSAYVVATIRAEEHVAEDPQAWACVGKGRAIDQKDGCFSSHWKSGFTATSPCRVDVRTRQVISIVPFDSACGKDVWWGADYETVEVDGEQHTVQNIDIITDRYAPADVYRELLEMEKTEKYWYSASGLDFYEELIKAHEAMQIVPESEESDEAPAGTTTWYIPATWSMSGYVQVQAESAKEAVRTAQEHVDEFDLPQNAQYVEDSFDIDEVAQPIPEIVLKDAGENNRPILPRDSGDIVTGLFVSHWNSGTQVVAPCDVNLKSREINNICAWFGPAEDESDQFIRETVTVNGQEYPVQNIDDLVVGLEPAEAYESLVRIKEKPSPQFWYSLNGRSLEGEIAKTKNAAEADSEDDSDTEIVHGLFTSRWDDGSVIVTGCKVDIQSRRIVEIEPSSDSCEDGSLLYETVTIHGEENPARNLDDIVGIEGAKEVYNELLRMKGNLEFWYSWSGLNFYEELVKAHLAAYPLHFCDEYCDEVTISIKENDSQFFEYRTDEDEVYSLHHPDDTWGERVSGILADSVRLFAKEQMRLSPGRWVTPEDCEDWPNAVLRASQWVEHKRNNILREVSDGRCEEQRLTGYYLPFISEDATHQLPTVDEYIDCAVNVKTNALIEIRMVADDRGLERYLHIPVKTSWPSVSFMDVLGNLEDDIRDMAKNGVNGFSYSRENDYPVWNATFFDKLGRGTELEFESLHELLRTIVSIRLVKVDNRIIEKNGAEAHT